MAPQPDRVVGVQLELDVHHPTEVVAAVAVSAGQPLASERLDVRRDGRPVAFRELEDAHGSRLQVFAVGAGRLRIGYRARVSGRAGPAPVTLLDRVEYRRPSRYVQSDALIGFARATFPGIAGRELATAVAAWVHDRLDYRPEASSPTGGAVETLDAGAGVCRDYAHLTAALLRALDVPARLVSVYAPGLRPMDFHAVVEALVENRWIVVDATRMAPRAAMVRIATGRDAADVAFVTTTGADVELRVLAVEASAVPPAAPDDVAAEDVAPDDPDEVVELG